MKFKTMSGGVLELPRASPKLAAFFPRLQEALADEAVTTDAFTALAYGLENPLLEERDGRAVVTADAHASPWYHAIADMLVRKQVQQDAIRFTLSVADAAAKLGYSESAIKQAISGGRLAARKIRNVLHINPDHLEAFAATAQRRGPKPQAERPEPETEDDLVAQWLVSRSLVAKARIGSKEGASFRIKGAQVEGTKHGSVRDGIVPEGWSRILVLASKGEAGARLWEIVPSPGDADAIMFEGFYLVGGFRIIGKENNARRARETFDRLGRDLFSVDEDILRESIVKQILELASGFPLQFSTPPNGFSTWAECADALQRAETPNGLIRTVQKTNATLTWIVTSHPRLLALQDAIGRLMSDMGRLMTSLSRKR